MKRSDNKNTLDVLENTADSYWEWDILNSEKFTSDQFWSMFGYDSKNISNYNNKLNDIVFPEDLSKLEDNLRLHFKTKGLHPFKQEIRCRHKNGTTIWILCIGKVVKWSSDGRALKMVGSHTEITTIKKEQEELDRNIRLASIGEMAGSISHEINNPLAIINISLDWIKKSLSRPDFDINEIIKKIEISKKNITRASSVINGLKLYSESLDLNNRKHHKASVIIELTLSLLRDRLRKHKLNLENLIDKETLIYCDETQVSYVFFNIISQSISSLNRSPASKITIKSHKIKNNIFIEIIEKPHLPPSQIPEEPVSNHTPNTDSCLGIEASRSILKNHGGSLDILAQNGNKVYQVQLPVIDL